MRIRSPDGIPRTGRISTALDGMDLQDRRRSEAFKEAFRPEFINRIDDVVVFNELNVEVCTRIAQRMLKEVAELLSRSGIRVDFSPGVRSALAREGSRRSTARANSAACSSARSRIR